MKAAEPASSRYAWFVVAILMTAYVFSFVDRQILNLLVGPIRRDLGISDTQMSLLMGFSFALFYTLCGIPLGRLADSRSRRGLIAGGVVVWSVMTALCGTAKNFGQLFLCRIGVGVGEAALSPAAYSLISDYFPREQRATAISVYSMGVYLGAGIAFLLGGLVILFVSRQGVIGLPLIGEIRPWQLVFLILGGAGLVFSLALLLIREPARQGARAGGVPLREVLAYLKRNRRTVVCHNLGFAMLSFCGYGTGAWIPTYFIRNHGWDAGKVGLVYGTIVMVFGAAGILFGGRLADRWARRGVSDATMRVGLLAALLYVPFGLLYPLAEQAWMAAAALAVAVFFLSMPTGVAAAAIQDIMPNEMRGQASAIYLFAVSLIGLGIGPTAVALVTDYVFRDDQAVRYSLAIVGVAANLLGVVFLAAALKPYRQSVQRLHAAAAPA